MSQIQQVVRCFSCQTFQAQISKKSNKWQCKICQEKQSLKKVFFSGLGAECRKIVQDLNMQRGRLLEIQSSLSTSETVSVADELCHPDTQPPGRSADGESRWGAFLPPEDTTTDDCHGPIGSGTQQTDLEDKAQVSVLQPVDSAHVLSDQRFGKAEKLGQAQIIGSTYIRNVKDSGRPLKRRHPPEAAWDKPGLIEADRPKENRPNNFNMILATEMLNRNEDERYGKKLSDDHSKDQQHRADELTAAGGSRWSRFVLNSEDE